MYDLISLHLEYMHDLKTSITQQNEGRSAKMPAKRLLYLTRTKTFSQIFPKLFIGHQDISIRVR